MQITEDEMATNSFHPGDVKILKPFVAVQGGVPFRITRRLWACRRDSAIADLTCGNLCSMLGCGIGGAGASRPEYGNWERTYANEHQRPGRYHSRGGAAGGADAFAAGPHGGGLPAVPVGAVPGGGRVRAAGGGVSEGNYIAK